jgi:hypothetical protein
LVMVKPHCAGRCVPTSLVLGTVASAVCESF